MDALKRMGTQTPGKDPQAEKLRQESDAEKKRRRHKALEFDLKPKNVKEYLDRYVIKQEEAKRVLATTVCDHYNHVKECGKSDGCKDYTKQNVILLGPTGVGKTYLIRSLADLIGVPFVALAVGMQWQLWMADVVTTGRFPQLDMPRITSAFLGGIAGLIGGSLLSVGILRLIFRTRSH